MWVLGVHLLILGWLCFACNSSPLLKAESLTEAKVHNSHSRTKRAYHNYDHYDNDYGHDYADYGGHYDDNHHYDTSYSSYGGSSSGHQQSQGYGSNVGYASSTGYGSRSRSKSKGRSNHIGARMGGYGRGGGRNKFNRKVVHLVDCHDHDCNGQGDDHPISFGHSDYDDHYGGGNDHFGGGDSHGNYDDHFGGGGGGHYDYHYGGGGRGGGGYGSNDHDVYKPKIVIIKKIISQSTTTAPAAG